MKANTSSKTQPNGTALVPRWQSQSAQVATATYLQVDFGSNTAIYDADPYNRVLRMSAERMARFALQELGVCEHPIHATNFLRESALLVDLLEERIRARDARTAKRRGGKAVQS